MKKLLSLFLSLLILLSLFSACAQKKVSPPSASKDKDTETQTAATETVPAPAEDVQPEPKPDEPPAPVYKEPLLSASRSMPVTQYPAADKPAENLYTALLWGDSFVTANGLADTVTAFARYDGINLLFRSLVYENLGTLYTYNFYELFNYSGTDVASYKNEKLKSYIQRETDAFDFIVFLSGRDRTLASASNGDKTFNAFNLVQSEYLGNNPDGKIVLLVPAAYQNGHDGALANRYGLPAATKYEHSVLIDAYAERLADTVPDANESLAQMNLAFQFFTAAYGDSGIDLYDQSRIYPSIAGSYYMACILYSVMFGKSAYGIEEYGVLDRDSALLLQKAAHRFVFGAEPTEKHASSQYRPSFTETNPRTTSLRYEGYENEVYPEYFDELFATAYAFAGRGDWIQYDQMGIDKVNFSSIRRSNHMVPEDATPQNTMYLDCSGFTFALFYNTFGYNFGNENMRTAYLIDYESERIYYRDGRAPGDKSNEEAAAEVRGLLRPGDVIVYYDEKSDWGHVMTYIGNGTIIHCSGTSHSGGGTADYIFTANVDGKEYLGSILFNSVEELFSPDGKQYIFSSTRRFAILRPFDLALQPTEQASKRLEGLSGIIAYKETSAPRGITVNPGEDVTFTYVLRNDNPTAKSVKLTDTLPAELEYKNGEAVFKNKKLDTTVTVPAYGTLRLSYTAELSASAKLNTVIECRSAYAAGVLLNETPVYVANTLTLEERGKISSAAANVTASSDLEMINAVYDQATGRSLPFSDKAELVSGLLTLSSGSDYFNFDKNGVFADLLACGLIGGRAFGQDLDGKRPRHFGLRHLMTGDVILVMADTQNCELWLCLDSGKLACVEDGAVKIISAGTAATKVESLFGQFTFCLIRPSQGMLS